ncbi:MAG: thrombospondin type 3 repeat-containing protein [Deltaproteobacteria bacterium]|nr:thrombospondin type 3 repeat-containing protein [Deltaproteobacteria bacterium]
MAVAPAIIFNSSAELTKEVKVTFSFSPDAVNFLASKESAINLVAIYDDQTSWQQISKITIDTEQHLISATIQPKHSATIQAVVLDSDSSLVATSLPLSDLQTSLGLAGQSSQLADLDVGFNGDWRALLQHNGNSQQFTALARIPSNSWREVELPTAIASANKVSINELANNNTPNIVSRFTAITSGSAYNLTLAAQCNTPRGESACSETTCGCHIMALDWPGNIEQRCETMNTPESTEDNPVRLSEILQLSVALNPQNNNAPKPQVTSMAISYEALVFSAISDGIGSRIEAYNLSDASLTLPLGTPIASQQTIVILLEGQTTEDIPIGQIEHITLTPKSRYEAFDGLVLFTDIINTTDYRIRAANFSPQTKKIAGCEIAPGAIITLLGGGEQSLSEQALSNCQRRTELKLAKVNGLTANITGGVVFAANDKLWALTPKGFLTLLSGDDQGGCSATSVRTTCLHDVVNVALTRLDEIVVSTKQNIVKIGVPYTSCKYTKRNAYIGPGTSRLQSCNTTLYTAANILPDPTLAYFAMINNNEANVTIDSLTFSRSSQNNIASELAVVGSANNTGEVVAQFTKPTSDIVTAIVTNKAYSVSLPLSASAEYQGKIAANAAAINYASFILRLDDIDGDGLSYELDNCPLNANTYVVTNELACLVQEKHAQIDGDNDGIGDVCDICPKDKLNDIDKDNLCAEVDNCPNVANSNQSDVDGDGMGDACETNAAANDPNTHAGAIEICDGLDNNGNGQIDEGLGCEVCQ